jgi:hypothetical protein
VASATPVPYRKEAHAKDHDRFNGRASVVAHGEASVDPMENALVIDSDEGTFAKFNWAHVLYYHITSESY